MNTVKPTPPVIEVLNGKAFRRVSLEESSGIPDDYYLAALADGVYCKWLQEPAANTCKAHGAEHCNPCDW